MRDLFAILLIISVLTYIVFMVLTADFRKEPEIRWCVSESGHTRVKCHGN